MSSEIKNTKSKFSRSNLEQGKSSLKQKTVRSSISCNGVGLHSGKKISMTIHPADINTGIIFRRSDLKRPSLISASWTNVTDTMLATTITNESGSSVGTVEHLMAAFAGCGIDNAIVELDGPEVPIMDGSAAPFMFLVECAGSVSQNAARRAILIKKTIRVGNEKNFISLSPASAFGITFAIEFDTSAVERQFLDMQLVNGTFKNEIARARTFGFAHEVDAMRKAGLALGGSLENAIVIEGNTILNEDGLRYKDEFVRHKVLDCIGDLYLAGAPIIGKIDGYRSGHNLNHRLLCALFEDDTSWSYVELTDEVVPGTTQKQNNDEHLLTA